MVQLNYMHTISEIYKNAYDMYICNGILFNHESKRRGENFITQKIILFAKQYNDNKKGFLKVGNLNSKRDWGDAEDYIYAMWLMLQQKKPRNYIVATNKSITVRKFIELVFNKIQVKIKWSGKGLSEVGIDKETNKIIIKVDKQYFRPIDVNFLKGDYAETLRSRKPKTSLDQLINKMLED